MNLNALMNQMKDGDKMITNANLNLCLLTKLPRRSKQMIHNSNIQQRYLTITKLPMNWVMLFTFNVASRFKVGEANSSIDT